VSRFGELIPHREDDGGCLCGCQDEPNECGYAWFHESAFGRDLIACNRPVDHDGKHERSGD
jgi:hypothetical protein